MIFGWPKITFRSPLLLVTYLNPRHWPDPILLPYTLLSLLPLYTFTLVLLLALCFASQHELIEGLKKEFAYEVWQSKEGTCSCKQLEFGGIINVLQWPKIFMAARETGLL